MASPMKATDYDFDFSQRAPRRLTWVTDPHLNFVEDPSALDAALTDAGVVLIGGDIGEADDFEAHLRRLSNTLQRPICFVLGNHDYYGGEIAAVRSRARALMEARALERDAASIVWLGAGQVVKLSKEHALVGHGGWGDARLGDFMGTPVRLNDHRLIKDLSGLPRDVLKERLHALGEDAAQHMSAALTRALSWARQVTVLTHVPPFEQACWYEGRTSDMNWLADFTCHATGLALLAAADAHPTASLRVLCGHTHHRGEATLRDNLTTLTGAAVYGAPQVERSWCI